jgi:TolB-like protein
MLRFMHFFLLMLGLSVLAGCGARQEQYRTVLPTDPNYIAAQEVKLKVRELADQLIASVPNDALAGVVALPTSFVNQNDYNSSSPLGRYLAEGLIYEFNQRGFPVREYRTDGSITMNEGMGEKALARKGKIVTAKGRGNALLIGTYHQDPDAIFVNARLVRSSDGIVLRTGQIMLTPTAITLRMTNAGPDSMPMRASSGGGQNKPGEMAYAKPEPGGPLFAYAAAPKSGGMKIRQAPPVKTRVAASKSQGLMGYAPE